MAFKCYGNAAESVRQWLVMLVRINLSLFFYRNLIRILWKWPSQKAVIIFLLAAAAAAAGMSLTVGIFFRFRSIASKCWRQFWEITDQVFPILKKNKKKNKLISRVPDGRYNETATGANNQPIGDLIYFHIRRATISRVRFRQHSSCCFPPCSSRWGRSWPLSPGRGCRSRSALKASTKPVRYRSATLVKYATLPVRFRSTVSELSFIQMSSNRSLCDA